MRGSTKIFEKESMSEKHSEGFGSWVNMGARGKVEERIEFSSLYIWVMVNSLIWYWNHRCWWWLEGGNISSWLTYFPNGDMQSLRNFTKANCIDRHTINNDSKITDKTLQLNHKRPGKHKNLFMKLMSETWTKMEQSGCINCICYVATAMILLQQ